MEESEPLINLRRSSFRDVKLIRPSIEVREPETSSSHVKCSTVRLVIFLNEAKSPLTLLTPTICDEQSKSRKRLG